jgi:hypothetical protein
MSQVGFEPTIPAFEREKAFNTLECAATVIGVYAITELKNSQSPIMGCRAFDD